MLENLRSLHLKKSDNCTSSNLNDGKKILITLISDICETIKENENDSRIFQSGIPVSVERI